MQYNLPDDPKTTTNRVCKVISQYSFCVILRVWSLTQIRLLDVIFVA